jgi:hypothetical protein
LTKTNKLPSFARERDINIETIITNEIARLCVLYEKTFLDCEDLVTTTGLGRDNVRALMNSKAFPLTKVGNRQVVSILAFVTWQMMGGNT